GQLLARLGRIWLGFGIATVLGVGLGLLIGRFGLAEDTLLPPIELFRPIPAVAWVPISIMLWPTERSSIVFITTLGAFFPIVLNTIHGVEGIDRQLVRAATSLGAGRAAIFREVVLPGALPSIVTGLSVGMGVSWICLISAEMISGQFGVGYFTWVAYGIVKYSQIVVGMLTIGVLGMLSSALIRWDVAGRVRPPVGRVVVDGVQVAARGGDRGMVVQQHSVFPWETVLGNGEFGLKMRGIGPRERASQARAYLNLVGLTGFERAYPGEL